MVVTYGVRTTATELTLACTSSCNGQRSAKPDALLKKAKPNTVVHGITAKDSTSLERMQEGLELWSRLLQTRAPRLWTQLVAFDYDAARRDYDVAAPAPLDYSTTCHGYWLPQVVYGEQVYDTSSRYETGANGALVAARPSASP